MRRDPRHGAARARPGPAALEAIIRRQDAAREANDFDRFYVLDDELHQLLCDLSGHDIAWSLEPARQGTSEPHPATEHARARLHDGDDRRAPGRRRRRRGARPRRGRAALRHHLRMVLSTLPAIRAQHPDYFEEEIA